jgi:4-hydroxy-tetrahydrodipicolinate reductase
MIQHQANSRDGFALGALLAAQWAIDKKGIWNFSDLIADEIR